jgi:hypothetical protein
MPRVLLNADLRGRPWDPQSSDDHLRGPTRFRVRAVSVGTHSHMSGLAENWFLGICRFSDLPPVSQPPTELK